MREEKSANKIFLSMYKSKKHRINFLNPSSLLLAISLTLEKLKNTMQKAENDQEKDGNENQHNSIL